MRRAYPQYKEPYQKCNFARTVLHVARTLDLVRSCRTWRRECDRTGCPPAETLQVHMVVSKSVTNKVKMRQIKNYYKTKLMNGICTSQHKIKLLFQK